MAILYGMGRPTVTTVLASGETVLLPIEPMEFTLSPSVNTVRSTKFLPDGTVGFAGTAKQRKTWTLRLGIEAITWATMQFALGEIATIEAAPLILPELRFATLPLTGALEIVDSTILATSVIQAAVYGDNKPTFLTNSGVTAPAFGQFQIQAGKLVIGGTLAQLKGEAVGYRVLVSQPTVESIGLNNAAQVLSKFAFEGVLATDGPKVIISIPTLAAVSEPTIPTQGVAKFELEYDLINPSGYNKPFRLFNVAP
jgi:hypothetical protein